MTKTIVLVCLRTLIATGVLLPAGGRFAHAQEFPAKAVRIIVPLAPGGPNDLAVRPVAQKLYEFLGQPFVIGGHVDSMFISAPGARAAGHADFRRNGLSRSQGRYALRPGHHSTAGITSFANNSIERRMRAWSMSPNQKLQLKCVMPTSSCTRLIWRITVSGVPMTR